MTAQRHVCGMEDKLCAIVATAEYLASHFSLDRSSECTTLSPQASKQSSASAASGAKSLWAMKAGRLNLRMALLTSQNDMYTIGRGNGEMLGGDACTLQVKKRTRL